MQTAQPRARTRQASCQQSLHAACSPPNGDVVAACFSKPGRKWGFEKQAASGSRKMTRSVPGGGPIVSCPRAAIRSKKPLTRPFRPSRRKTAAQDARGSTISDRRRFRMPVARAFFQRLEKRSEKLSTSGNIVPIFSMLGNPARCWTSPVRLGEGGARNGGEGFSNVCKSQR